MINQPTEGLQVDREQSARLCAASIGGVTDAQQKFQMAQQAGGFCSAGQDARAVWFAAIEINPTLDHNVNGFDRRVLGVESLERGKLVPVQRTDQHRHPLVWPDALQEIELDLAQFAVCDKDTAFAPVQFVVHSASLTRSAT